MSFISFLNRNIQVRRAEVDKHYCLRNLTFHQQLKSTNKKTPALLKSSDLSSTWEQMKISETTEEYDGAREHNQQRD